MVNKTLMVLQTGRDVPVIIPDVCRNALKYITDENVQQKTKIIKKNPYLFARTGIL